MIGKRVKCLYADQDPVSRSRFETGLFGTVRDVIADGVYRIKWDDGFLVNCLREGVDFVFEDGRTVHKVHGFLDGGMLVTIVGKDNEILSEFKVGQNVKEDNKG